jgi:hypothetical protein
MIILKDGQKFESTPQLNPDKVAQLVKDGVWTDEDLAREGLEAAEPFQVPEGKVAVGAPTYKLDDKTGKWVEERQVEDKPPPPPEPTNEEKLLNSTGLTVQELKELLA